MKLEQHEVQLLRDKITWLEQEVQSINLKAATGSNADFSRSKKLREEISTYRKILDQDQQNKISEIIKRFNKEK